MPCYIRQTDTLRMFICGDLGPHCMADGCADSSEYQCDFPVGDGKTCDLYLCDLHASEVAPNIHYCPGHLILWREFRDSGRVEAELKNVIPYKQT